MELYTNYNFAFLKVGTRTRTIKKFYQVLELTLELELVVIIQLLPMRFYALTRPEFIC